VPEKMLVGARTANSKPGSLSPVDEVRKQRSQGDEPVVYLPQYCGPGIRNRSCPPAAGWERRAISMVAQEPRPGPDDAAGDGDVWD
jgi:hypothetical protein